METSSVVRYLEVYSVNASSHLPTNLDVVRDIKGNALG
jgi:hypothetical protein